MKTTSTTSKVSTESLKPIHTLLLSFLVSSMAFAQTDKIRVDYTPALAMTLKAGYTQESWPSSTTTYAPVFTHSFALNYLKGFKNDHFLKTGIGLFSTGHEASYSQDPPIYFSGRTDQLSASYLQIPISYVLTKKNLNIELGISGNVLIAKNRSFGDGPTDNFALEAPFNSFAFGLITGLYYNFNLSELFSLNTGLAPQYLITENQLNCGLLIALDYDFN